MTDAPKDNSNGEDKAPDGGAREDVERTTNSPWQPPVYEADVDLAAGDAVADPGAISPGYQYETELQAEEVRLIKLAQRDMPPARSAPPRLLVLLWCMWLLGSWMATLSGDLSLASVRRMMYACLIGLMVVWPTVRLSQGIAHTRRSPRKAVLLAFGDWVSLFAVFQLVPWSMKITLDWSAGQVFWLDAAMGVWSLLAAAAVAWGLAGSNSSSTSGAARRTVALGLCLAIVLAEPLAMWLVGLIHPGWGGWRMAISPLQVVWELSEPRASWTPWPWSYHVQSVGAAAGLVWLVLVWWSGLDSEKMDREADAAVSGR